MPAPHGNLSYLSQQGTPSLLRAINEQALLTYLRAHGPTSRAQLARATGLSKPTVSQALASLEQAQLVKAVGQSTSSKGGRVAILYEPNPEAGYVIGIDVGRAWVRAAVANLAGHILARADEHNHAQNASSLVAFIRRIAHDLLIHAGLSWSQVIHAVIGTPGVLDPQSQRVLFSANLPEWGKQGLLAELQAALHINLSIENDANLAAIGERTFGWGTDANTFVSLTIGTGVGMGIVINGTLYRGAHGAAGEIGFLPFTLNTIRAHRTTLSENYLGLFEEATSAEGIVRLAQQHGLPPSFSVKQIFDAAEQGNSQAVTIIEQEGSHLALAIATIAAVLDPELIVIGGGIGQRIELLRAPLERHLQQLTPLHPPIVATKLGADSVLLGALATALETAHHLVFQHYFTGQ